MQNIEIIYKDNKYIFPVNVTLLEISEQFKHEYKYDIIIASVNNKITELNKTLDRDATIKFYDLTSLLGSRVYERGLVYLYIKAVKDVLKSEVIIKHSIDKGIYTQIVNDIKVTEDDINAITDYMNKLINLSISFERLSVSRIDAINYFESINRFDKADSLKYISNTFVNLYKFDSLYDYFYGEMPINTSYLKWFSLTKVNSHGIILTFPNIYFNSQIIPYVHHEKIFLEFKRKHEWSELFKLDSMADLNKIVSQSKIKELIYICEVEQNGRLLDIARNINSNQDIKVVLITGPSSSGKTTTSKKLSLYLKSMGLKPQSLSLDDYFIDRDKMIPLENGKYDFENIDAIDLDLFNEQLVKILNKEEVLLPEFNFITGKKEYNNKRLKIDDKGILIIEGLHALNDEIAKNIDVKNKYKIYISPLTGINLDNHNRISTTDNRLLRRLIRDNQSRGYSASVTLARWQDVRIGEEKYVFPYQDKADIVFNTSLLYEFGILRLYAEPLLFSIDEEDPYYGEAIRLLNILKNTLPIMGDDIPLDSIIREFIGNSFFRE